MTEVTGATLGPPEGMRAAEPPAPRQLDVPEVDRIAEALCARARRCDQIGVGRPYPSADECMTPARRVARKGVEDAQCVAFREESVAECVVSVERQPCDGEVDVSDLRPCRRTELCL